MAIDLFDLKSAFLEDWQSSTKFNFPSNGLLTLREKVNMMKNEHKEPWLKPDDYWLSRVGNIIMRNASENVFKNFHKDGHISYLQVVEWHQKGEAEAQLSKRIPNARVDFPGRNKDQPLNADKNYTKYQLVPSKFTKVDGKVNNKAAHVMYSFLHILNNGGLAQFFMVTDNESSALKLFTKMAYGSHHTLDISEKQVINTFMDVYHPKFRNGFIPIDSNWKKLSTLLALSNNYLRAMHQILAFKRSYPDLDEAMSDWEFDRLYFYALKWPKTHLAMIINQGQMSVGA